jgi:hypothetical protein
MSDNRVQQETDEYIAAIRDGKASLNLNEMIKIMERNGCQAEADQIKHGYEGKGKYHGRSTKR